MKLKEFKKKRAFSDFPKYKEIINEAKKEAKKIIEEAENKITDLAYSNELAINFTKNMQNFTPYKSLGNKHQTFFLVEKNNA